MASPSIAHWDKVSEVFAGFSDAELADYINEQLSFRSAEFKERVLVSLTLQHAKVTETFRKAARENPLIAQGAPGYLAPHMFSTHAILPLRFVLVSREAFTLSGTSQVVAHQFRVATSHPHAIPPDSMHSVSIAGPQPACDCPEFLQKPGLCCQHILFVYVHVLRHPQAQQIFQQMGPATRLPPPITDPTLPLCALCFQPLSSNEYPPCSTCRTHALCLDVWRRAVLKVYGGGLSCPCRVEPANYGRTLQADGKTLTATPVKISGL